MPDATLAPRSSRADQLAAAVRAGALPRDVAAQFNVSMSTVRNACFQRGVRCHDRPDGREFLPEGATMHQGPGYRPYATMPGVEGRLWFCRDCNRWHPEHEFRSLVSRQSACGLMSYCRTAEGLRDKRVAARKLATARARSIYTTKGHNPGGPSPRQDAPRNACDGARVGDRSVVAGGVA